MARMHNETAAEALWVSIAYNMDVAAGVSLNDQQITAFAERLMRTLQRRGFEIRDTRGRGAA